MAIHRTKRSSENVCPECMEEARRSVKSCFFCDKEYDDDGMVIGSGDNVVQGNALAMMFGAEDARQSAVESALQGMMVTPDEHSKGSSSS